MDLMEARRRILLANSSGMLPPKYAKLEYIINPGYAFLKLDYYPVRGDEFDIKYTLDTEPTDYACLFSVGASTYQTIALKGTGSMYFYCRYFTSNSATNLITTLNLGTWYRMTVSSSGVFETNGVTSTSTPNGEISDTNSDKRKLWIFRRASTAYPWVGKLKSFKVSNNGVLKVNLIPCQRKSDSKVGMYDTVSKTFYGSASSNASAVFTAPT